MRFIKSLSSLLILIAIGLALYEACSSFFMKPKIKIRSVEELATDLSKPAFERARVFFANLLPPDVWKLTIHLPAPVLLLALGLFIYLIFRLICLVLGKNPAEYTLRGRNYAQSRRIR